MVNVYLEEAEIAGDPKESVHYNLFSDYRVDKQALWYPIIFWLRRYVVILTLTLLSAYKLQQIAIYQIATSVVIYYLSVARPQRSTFVRNQEIVNELMVMIATYPLYCFTDYVYDLDRRLESGWCLVGCILLNILFNMVLILIQAVFQTYKKIKLWKLRKIAQKEHEKRQE